MSDSYRDILIADLRTVAPVGTTVFVQTAAPDRVRLFVETEADDVMWITQRVGALLDVEQNTSDDTIDGDIGIVGRLSMHLYGATGSLFAAAATS